MNQNSKQMNLEKRLEEEYEDSVVRPKSGSGESQEMENHRASYRGSHRSENRHNQQRRENNVASVNNNFNNNDIGNDTNRSKASKKEEEFIQNV